MNTRTGDKGRITCIYGRKDRKLKGVQVIETRMMECVSNSRVFELMSLGNMAAMGKHIYPEHAALCYLLADKILDNPGVQRELGEATIQQSRQMLDREKSRLKAAHRIDYDAMLRAVRSGQMHIDGQPVVVAKLLEDRNPPMIQLPAAKEDITSDWRVHRDRFPRLGGGWNAKPGSLLPAGA